MKLTDLAEGSIHNLGFLSMNILARGKALYKGHPIAAVAAVNAHVAEEALALIKVDYEVLKPVLTASEAMRVFRKACMVAGGLNQRAVSRIVSEKRQALRRTNALSFHESPAGMGDVGGLDELKRWLRERRRAFDDQACSFDLPLPRGLLLLGVQGCGKSLSAKAVAREWQFPLLRLDLAAAFGSAEKSPEATIREASTIAESIAPAVLWIDEIEKGFAASAADPSASRVFGWFLTWLSEKTSPVFVVATANDVEALPPELLRRGRFDEIFFVDLPTQDRKSVG